MRRNDTEFYELNGMKETKPKPRPFLRPPPLTRCRTASARHDLRGVVPLGVANTSAESDVTATVGDLEPARLHVVDPLADLPGREVVVTLQADAHDVGATTRGWPSEIERSLESSPQPLDRVEVGRMRRPRTRPEKV